MQPWKIFAALLACGLGLAGSAVADQWSGEWNAAVRYDSRTARVAADAQAPEGAGDHVFFTRLRLRCHEFDPWRLGYSFYKNWRQDQHELDILSHGVEASRTWSGDDALWGLLANYDHFVHDGGSYYERILVRPSYTRFRGRHWFSAHLEYGREIFRIGSDRTGRWIGGGIRLPIPTRQIGRNAEVAAWSSRKRTNNELYSHTETGAAVHMRQAVFFVVDDVSLQASALEREYDRTAARPRRRTDRRTELWIRTGREIGSDLRLEFEASWRDNESNIQAEEFSRSSYTLTLIKSF